MTYRTDVCITCEQHRQAVVAAVQEEKVAALAAFSTHLHEAEKEQGVHVGTTSAAHTELEDHHPVIA